MGHMLKDPSAHTYMLKIRNSFYLGQGDVQVENTKSCKNGMDIVFFKYYFLSVYIALTNAKKRLL